MVYTLYKLKIVSIKLGYSNNKPYLCINKKNNMNTIKDTIVDLCYLNYSNDQIVDYLILNQLTTNQDKESFIEIINEVVKEHQEELEADSYLGSLECYYDNYCEY